MAPSAADEPRLSAMVRAVVMGLTSGKTCVLRLAPNGVVRGASSCAWSGVLVRVQRWRRSADCIYLLTAEHVLLAFRATGGGAFRAEGVEPETLELRLLSATSMPVSP